MLRILIVEDDPSVRLMLEVVLSRHGYWVQTAPSARDATAMLLYDFPVVPDLAVLDIRLPGISGIEYGEDLRRHFPSIRLVFMTGWGEQRDERQAARALGPLLVKPFHSADLLEIVRAAAGRPEAPRAALQ